MNVSAIGPTYAPPAGRIAQPATVVAPRSAPGAAAPATSRVGGAELPVEAPQNTDAQLWSVLTSPERAYFSRAGVAGSLTYGPAGGNNAAAMRGQAFDRKV